MYAWNAMPRKAVLVNGLTWYLNSGKRLVFYTERERIMLKWK